MPNISCQQWPFKSCPFGYFGFSDWRWKREKCWFHRCASPTAEQKSSTRRKRMSQVLGTKSLKFLLIFTFPGKKVKKEEPKTDKNLLLFYLIHLPCKVSVHFNPNGSSLLCAQERARPKENKKSVSKTKKQNKIVTGLETRHVKLYPLPKQNHRREITSAALMRQLK